MGGADAPPHLHRVADVPVCPGSRSIVQQTGTSATRWRARGRLPRLRWVIEARRFHACEPSLFPSCGGRSRLPRAASDSPADGDVCYTKRRPRRFGFAGRAPLPCFTRVSARHCRGVAKCVSCRAVRRSLRGGRRGPPGNATGHGARRRRCPGRWRGLLADCR